MQNNVFLNAVYIHGTVRSMTAKVDFSRCLLLHTVMAARALSRRYDERMKPFGVTVAQFAVMMTVRRNAGQTVSAMAARIAMDRTTLSRNLDLLERKGLVVKDQAAPCRPCWEWARSTSPRSRRPIAPAERTGPARRPNGAGARSQRWRPATTIRALWAVRTAPGHPEGP
jgi:hypothetical protein